MMVRASGLRFHVVDEGKGTPIVLLHGFPDTARIWRSQIEALTAAGYRAIAPDLRGRGRSERPGRVSDYALSALVGDVTGIMDALGVRRAHVVGHDWGAGVAWALASLFPQRVDHLVVISVGFPGVTRPDLEALQKAWYRLLFLFEGTAEELLQKDDWYLLRETLQGRGDVEQYIADLSEPGALTAGLNWYRANLPADRLLGPPPELPPVQAPTLGIFGTAEPYLTETSMVRSKERVRGPWRYERLEGIGHWVQLEAAERLNALLLEFLPKLSKVDA
jgi:pimeloyl-ACP methyl ester carboxylesterase